MTTGRINQVTTFHATLRMAYVGTQHPERHLSRREFINKVIKTIFARPCDDLAIIFRLSTYSLFLKVGHSIPLYPDLTSLRDASPRPFHRRRSHPSKGTTSNRHHLKRHTRSRRIPNVVNRLQDLPSARNPHLHLIAKGCFKRG